MAWEHHSSLIPNQGASQNIQGEYDIMFHQNQRLLKRFNFKTARNKFNLLYKVLLPRSRNDLLIFYMFWYPSYKLYFILLWNNMTSYSLCTGNTIKILNLCKCLKTRNSSKITDFVCILLPPINLRPPLNGVVHKIVSALIRLQSAIREQKVASGSHIRY